MADRHPLSREALAAALTAVEGFEVVGLAGTCTEAIARSGSLRPDVTLLDLDLDGVGVSGTLLEMLAGCPGSAVVALTIYPDDPRVEGALGRGARAHLSKGATLEEVSRTIRRVRDGDRLAPARLTPRIHSPRP